MRMGGQGGIFQAFFTTVKIDLGKEFRTHRLEHHSRVCLLEVLTLKPT